MHVRQQIRAAVATALTGITGIGTRVYANRSTPLQSGDLPAIRVQTLEEQVEFLTFQNLDRQLTLTVELIGREDYSAATLDGYAESIETNLAADPTLGGLVIDSHLTGTELEMDDASNVRQLTLSYLIKYSTAPGTPGTAVV